MQYKNAMQLSIYFGRNLSLIKREYQKDAIGFHFLFSKPLIHLFIDPFIPLLTYFCTHKQPFLICVLVVYLMGGFSAVVINY